MSTITNSRVKFYYDPTRQGYDTNLFKTVSGSPTVSGGAIRLNAAKIIGYADLYRADQTMKVKVPAAPTSGDVRTFGFFQINANAYAVFKVVDAVFSCECVFNGVTKNEVVTWQSVWTNTFTDFRIVFNGFSAEFYVGGYRVAFINDASVPKVALSTYAHNANADNMDINYIEVEAQNYI